jgi:hypothetical protein
VIASREADQPKQENTIPKKMQTELPLEVVPFRGLFRKFEKPRMMHTLREHDTSAIRTRQHRFWTHGVKRSFRGSERA